MISFALFYINKRVCCVIGALFIALGLSACSHIAAPKTHPQANSQPQADTTPSALTAKQNSAPEKNETPIKWRNFPKDSLYQLLTAEIATQRQNYSYALSVYLEQAAKLQDANLAKQSVMLAKYINAYPQALRGAQLWLKLEPNSSKAIANAAYISSKLGQFDKAMEYLGMHQHQGYANYAGLAARSLNFPKAQQAVVYQRLSQQTIANTKREQQLDINLAKALLLNEDNKTRDALSLLEQNIRTPFIAQEPLQGTYIRSLVLASEIKLKQAKQISALTPLQQFTQKHPKQIEARWHYARLLSRVDNKAGLAEFAALRIAAPEDQQVNFSYARLLFLNKDLAKAAVEFKPLLYSSRYRNQALYHLGLISIQAGKADQAEQFWTLIPPGKTYFAATKARVGLHLTQGKTDAAITLLNQAQKQDSANRISYVLLSHEILNEQKQWQKSHQLLTQALELDSEDPQLLYARAMVNERLDRLDILEQDLQAIINKDPNNSLALNALGYTLADRTQRYPEALELISRAYRLTPDDPAILDSMGWIHFRLGNLEKARQFIEQALEKMPDPEIIAHYCEILWLSHEQEKASNLLQQALNKSPNHSILLQTQKRLGIRFAPDPAKAAN